VQCGTVPALYTSQIALRTASLGQRVCWHVTPCRLVADRFALTSKHRSAHFPWRRRRREPSKRLEPVTRQHDVTPVQSQQNCCTNCSHIPIPMSRANFQQIQRVIWQSAHCMLLKYCACSAHKERTTEMCRNDLLIAFALCSPICSPHAALGCTVTASHNCNMPCLTECPANCKHRDVTVRCSVVCHERKNQERK
jgi:hypothetical protein